MCATNCGGIRVIQICPQVWNSNVMSKIVNYHVVMWWGDWSKQSRECQDEMWLSNYEMFSSLERQSPTWALPPPTAVGQYRCVRRSIWHVPRILSHTFVVMHARGQNMKVHSHFNDQMVWRTFSGNWLCLSMVTWLILRIGKFLRTELSN